MGQKQSGTLIFANGEQQATQWALVEEVPLQLLINGASFGVMMITPRDIEDFVRGFCFTEGLLANPEDADVRIEQAPKGVLVNVVCEPLPQHEERQRHLIGRSSCGLCGAQTLADALRPLPRQNTFLLDENAIFSALSKFGEKQVLNKVNKSTHGAALASQDGEIIALREDVGRHNALDKLIGATRATAREDCFLILSSRMSLEMVQKAAIAGFAHVVSLSAPTQLALTQARDCDMVLYVANADSLMRFD